MSKVSVSQVYIAASAPDLWALVGDPEGLASWHPAIAHSPIVDGDRRLVTLEDGATVKERITRHSDEDMSYSYEILESPLPISGYVSTVSVQAEGDGARLTWTSEFEPAGAPAADVEAMIRGLYEAGFQSVGTKIS